MAVDVTVSKEVHSIAMQQINYYMAPRAHNYAKYWHSSDVMPEGRTVVTSLLFQYLAYGTRGHVITNT